MRRRPPALAPALAGCLLAASCLAAGCSGGPAGAPAGAAATPAAPSGSASGSPPAGRARPGGPTPPAPPAPPAAVPAPGAATGTPVRLAFGGDVHFEGAAGARLAADPATALGPIAPTLRAADLAMVNLETAVTTRGTPAPKAFVFRAPASAFTALRAAGVDVTTMANNHGMDYGPLGLRDSVAAARAARFPVVGIGLDDAQAYAPYRLTVRGQRVAVVGATQVLDDDLIAAWTAGPGRPGLASAKTVDRLVRAVRAARQGADTLVVYLHWGRELSSCPTDDQRRLARTLVDAGADVVVGSHAHVLLGGGRLGGAYVDYGLGNFVFYAGGGPTTESGVLTLTVRGRAVTRAEWTPARISGAVPLPLSGTDAAAATARWERLRACTGLAPVG